MSTLLCNAIMTAASFSLLLLSSSMYCSYSSHFCSVLLRPRPVKWAKQEKKVKKKKKKEDETTRGGEGRRRPPLSSFYCTDTTESELNSASTYCYWTGVEQGGQSSLSPISACQSDKSQRDSSSHSHQANISKSQAYVVCVCIVWACLVSLLLCCASIQCELSWVWSIHYILNWLDCPVSVSLFCCGVLAVVRLGPSFVTSATSSSSSSFPFPPSGFVWSDETTYLNNTVLYFEWGSVWLPGLTDWLK